jgi:hypothetical protein
MQFAIPVKIVNLATNGTIFTSNHSVLIGGAPAEYGDNSVVRYPFDDSITSVILTNPFSAVEPLAGQYRHLDL